MIRASSCLWRNHDLLSLFFALFTKYGFLHSLTIHTNDNNNNDNNNNNNNDDDDDDDDHDTTTTNNNILAGSPLQQ